MKATLPQTIADQNHARLRFVLGLRKHATEFWFHSKHIKKLGRHICSEYSLIVMSVTGEHRPGVQEGRDMIQGLCLGLQIFVVQVRKRPTFYKTLPTTTFPEN